jgi:SAM-dependent methyltransferase
MNRALHEPPPPSEPSAVAARYARREGMASDRYSFYQPDVVLSVQERQRAMLALLREHGVDMPLARVLEIGCGAGGNLLELLRLGFRAEHLAGVELLEDRFKAARHHLPQATTLWLGDALALPVPEATQDIVLQSTVFSSLLDDGFQAQLASALWRWVKPGGAVLWYDFTVNNPRNPDVRGVPLARIRALFPQGRITARRVTLAPPLARAVVKVHPALYTVFNALPLLRTHVLCWIEKSS